ncbi:hypothetical protein M408DRAFT_332154 [Serendipita vermifera MAFF 305830]|uniref:F-box domain-containing protein n=1 Tax=Serendipita vermifera MAFF 305830 TaxID=933852 RepID=A0A0C3AGL4_SERVB|nr:hypothetical protein M408DRAFT_332154 [Serendipita vermifera MAFF 305830]
MSTASLSQVDSVVLLKPRPKTHPSVNLVLLPLLPTPSPRDPLPSEIWARILRHTMEPEPDARTAWEGQAARLRLVRVCKSFKEVMLPLLYSRPHLPTYEHFVLLCERILDADRKWDNLRRIAYSTPGRWVNSLDLTLCSHLTPAQNLKFDRLISQVFPVVPFLALLILHSTVDLTRQAMQSLGDSQAIRSLKDLRGIHVPPHGYFHQSEALTSLLRSCANLRHLELLGSGLDADAELPDPEVVYSPPQITLPQLHSMSILHTPFSPVLHALSRAELPSLRALTISIYVDAEGSDATRFLEAHGENLTTLTLAPAQTWPPTTTQIPTNVLVICPNLRYLSLPTTPVSLALTPPAEPSKLTILSVPRPNMEFLRDVIEPLLPSLREIRVREVRYLKRAMGVGAAGAGSSAVMLDWRRRLARRRVAVLDALGKDGP